MSAAQQTSTAAAGASSKERIIAYFTLAMIASHLVLRFGVRPPGSLLGLAAHDLPLIAALIFGGVPLVF
ncbi:MAG: hypothetical protein JSU87_06705, partial [Gemmatimonadota bacterium]